MATATANIRAMMSECMRSGVDVDALLTRVGLDRATTDDPDGRIPIETIRVFFGQALRATRDPAFALHVAENIPWGEFGVVDFITANSENVGEGLVNLCQYFRLVTEGAVLTYEDQGNRVFLQYDILEAPPEMGLYFAEFGLACIITRLRSHALGGLAVNKVLFRHEQPTYFDEYTRIFQAPMDFGQQVNGFFIDSGETTRKLDRASTQLAAILKTTADRLLASLPEARFEVANRVRQQLKDAYISGHGRDLNITVVAQTLGMSPRSLQNRLADEGFAFKAIHEDLRKQLACAFLLQPRMAIAEIAYLMGFSEPSAFHRAFKRWTGATPLSYRRSRAT